MGSSVRANCECGYEQEFLIGGGMTTFREICLFPCLCRDCNRIVQANLVEAPSLCPECESDNISPYDQGGLCEQQGGSVVTSWGLAKQLGRELTLTDSSYYCPLCDSFQLRFRDSEICWD